MVLLRFEWHSPVSWKLKLPPPLGAGNCFYVAIISQISLRGSPVCSCGFSCEALCTGEIHSLSGNLFFLIVFTKEITGLGCTWTLRRGCVECNSHLHDLYSFVITAYSLKGTLTHNENQSQLQSFNFNHSNPNFQF